MRRLPAGHLLSADAFDELLKASRSEGKPPRCPFTRRPLPPHVPARDTRLLASTPLECLRLDALVKRVPNWLTEHPQVLTTLMELWASPERKQRLAREEHAPLEQLGESKLLVKWKIGDWERLKELFSKYTLPEQPRIKMLQTYAAIHEGKLPDAELRCNEVIQAALHHWTSLPSLDAATHTPLLQIFQQFQELQESAQMLLEISNAQRTSSPPELSSILTTWRERLPNRWEDLPAWNDLVSWRNHMFSHINNVLARVQTDNPQVTTAAMQELLWTNTRFAHVARHQSLPEACVNIISKIQTVSSGMPSADLNVGFFQASRAGARVPAAAEPHGARPRAAPAHRPQAAHRLPKVGHLPHQGRAPPRRPRRHRRLRVR